MIKIGVIGYGYWGPNIVRNFSAIEGVKVTSVCDNDAEALRRAQRAYPHLAVFRDYRDLTTAKDIDAIAIVTPLVRHFAMAESALREGKHIFVEKPFTEKVAQAEQLIELADKKKLKIMVDHTFLFTGAVKKIKSIIADNQLGDLYYYDSTRVNLGLFQHDVNVMWDLAPHDLSIMDYVVAKKPAAIVAHGADHFGRGLEDVVYLTVYFGNNMIAHINVNWLSPVKIRTTLIGGQKKMLVWNDLEPDEKIRIYDKGVNINTKEGIRSLLVDYRSGDMWAPRVEHTEALTVGTAYFIDCILNNKTPFSNGHAGLRVVKMLEASDKSLKQAGKLINL